MFSPLELLAHRDFTGFVIFLLWFPVAATIHELAHALVATFVFGDHSAGAEDRLTPNPLAHMELMGGLMFALTGIGWGKPVPVNGFLVSKRGGKRAEVGVHLAGPAANLAVAVLLSLVLRSGLLPDLVDRAAGLGLLVNFMMAVVNLLPFSPLDGFRVVEAVSVSPTRRAVIEFLEKWGFVLLLLSVIFVLPSLIGFMLRILPL